LFGSAFWDKRFGLRKDFSEGFITKILRQHQMRDTINQREKETYIPFSFALTDDGGKAIATRKTS
jgi:hypothetical protein